MTFESFPREAMEAWDPEGDFTRVHMLNPALFRMLGDVRGARVLDAGCGQGYLGRLLASRGAEVTGVESARAMHDYAASRGGGVTYVHADLVSLPDLGAPFDAVVANMVLIDIADWKAAMRSCVGVLRRGGTFVFSITHPCFEESTSEWPAKGFVEVREYASEYERAAQFGVNYHRPLSTYVNEVIRLGCAIREVAEPTIDPDVASAEGGGAARLVHVPSVLVVAAERRS